MLGKYIVWDKQGREIRIYEDYIVRTCRDCVDCTLEYVGEVVLTVALFH
jgi:hypothetical protein